MPEDNKPQGPYKAYDLMTDALIGGYVSENAAYLANPGAPITVIYRPTKKRAAKKEFPYNGK